MAKFWFKLCSLVSRADDCHKLKGCHPIRTPDQTRGH